MDVVLADRLQFAFTIMFHYLFPITTMGLAPFVALYTIEGARGDADAAKAAVFWTKIFAVNFAIGVVTGIPMEFQFGTNWAAFSAASGSVIGQPLAMEGVYAFFLESIFLGVLLYGKGYGPRWLHPASSVAVWFGSWLSGFFIVATDAWMQHPVGYTITPAGVIELTSLPAVLFSQWAWWQFLHVLCGALIAGGFVVAGIGAYYLLSKREVALARRFVDAGVVVAFIFSVLVIFPTGDRNGSDVSDYQPIKLAAMEGLFKTTKDASLAIIGMPDVRAHQLIDPVFVPDILEFSCLRKFQRERQRPRRIRRCVGASARAHVLRVPCDGRAGDDLCGDRHARGVVSLAQSDLRVACAALGADADDAVSVHCKRSGLGRNRGRAPTVGHLRADAYLRRRIAHGLRR